MKGYEKEDLVRILMDTSGHSLHNRDKHTAIEIETEINDSTELLPKSHLYGIGLPRGKKRKYLCIFTVLLIVCFLVMVFQYSILQDVA